MKIVLATSNKDKVKEIAQFLDKYNVVPLSSVMKPFEIIEDGKNFKENAIIKSKAVYKKICELGLEDEFIVLSDDSGIDIEAINGRPNIYSARYSGENATDKSNREKVIKEINDLNLNSSKAFYTACISISSKFGDFTTHGFMQGSVINKERGENGFGYDSIFIPNGFDKTLGELDESIKLKISHRTKGLELANYILDSINKKFSK